MQRQYSSVDRAILFVLFPCSTFTVHSFIVEKASFQKRHLTLSLLFLPYTLIAHVGYDFLSALLSSSRLVKPSEAPVFVIPSRVPPGRPLRELAAASAHWDEAGDDGTIGP